MCVSMCVCVHELRGADFQVWLRGRLGYEAASSNPLSRDYSF